MLGLKLSHVSKRGPWYRDCRMCWVGDSMLPEQWTWRACTLHAPSGHKMLASISRGKASTWTELSRTIRILSRSVHPNFLIFLGALIPRRSITRENRMGNSFGSLQRFLRHITMTFGSVVRALPFPWPWVNTGCVSVIQLSLMDAVFLT